MSNDARIRQLVEEVIETGLAPEVVCADEPEHLPEVAKRLNRLKRTERALERFFPAETVTYVRPAVVAEQLKLPRVDGYEVQDILGKGGMGIVYQAVHLATNRTVALKMLRYESHVGATDLERFNQEYKLLARLNHPRIVQVYDVGTAEGEPYFTMEFVKGGTLETILEDGPQNSIYAAQMVEKLTDAISAAHEQDIIHRDLKPSNVLLTVQQEPKVSDFGLARFAEGGPALTMTGFGVGTPSYMAPEQAAGRKTGQATDVYALGAILYQLVTGRPPFRGESNADTIQQILTLEPVAPSRLNSKVHRDLETICLKCLEKELPHRYPTAKVLGDRLRMFLEGRPIPDRPVGKPERCWRWCVRNAALATSIAFVALLVISLVTMYIVSSSELRGTRKKFQEREILFSAWDLGRKLCESGEIGHGLLLIAKALDSTSDNDAKLKESLSIELTGWLSHCHTLENVFSHPEAVLSLAVNSDAKTCVSGCADGVVRLWHLDTGDSEELARHGGAVRAVAVTPDGRTVISGGDDGELFFYDSRTRREVGRLTAHTGGVRAIAINPDGELALSGGMDSTARLWNLSSLTLKATFRHNEPVLTVAFDPMDNRFFTGGGKKSGEFCLYRTDQDESKPPLIKKPWVRAIRSSAFSPDGETLAFGDEDWETHYWDMDELKQDEDWERASDDFRPFASAALSAGTACCIAFCPSERPGRRRRSAQQLVLIGTQESSLAQFWDARELHTYWEMQKEIESLVIHEQGAPVPIPPTIAHPQPLTAVAFVPPRGDRFVTASSDGYVRVWRMAPGFNLKRFAHDRKDEVALRTVAIQASGELVASGDNNGNAEIWNAATGERSGESIECSDRVSAVMFTNDGKSLITGTRDGWLQMWDVRTRTEVQKPFQSSRGVSGLSLSKSGDFILLGTGGRAQRLTTRPFQEFGAPLQHNQEDPDVDVATAISPTGERYLTFGQDGRAKLWDSSGQWIATLTHQNETRSGSFSPDGAWALTASDDRTVRLWDASTGAPLTSFVTRNEAFAAAFINRDRVITCGPEGAQIWDLNLQRRLGPVCKLGDDILCVAVTPDGTTAVLGEMRGRGAIWSLPSPVLSKSTNILSWIQTEVAMQLDEGGGRHVLSGEEWLHIRH